MKSLIFLHSKMVMQVMKRMCRWRPEYSRSPQQKTNMISLPLLFFPLIPFLFFYFFVLFFSFFIFVILFLHFFYLSNLKSLPRIIMLKNTSLRYHGIQKTSWPKKQINTIKLKGNMWHEKKKSMRQNDFFFIPY